MNFNLAEIALKHKSMMYYIIAVVFVSGLFAYFNLGRMENPAFTIREMVITVAWPGASAEDIANLVVDPVEKQLQKATNLDYIKSFSRPGVGIIYVNLTEDTPAAQVDQHWLEVRNLVNDITGSLPSGTLPPAFDSQFDDVYGSIYAVTGADYSPEELRQRAETIRRYVERIKNVQTAELLGVQTQKIYIEVSQAKLAELGIPADTIANTIKKQGSMAPAGMVETSSDNVYLRVSGVFGDIEALRALPIRANGMTFMLGDIATIEQRYAEPPLSVMYFNGKPAIGIAISMVDGGDMLQLGKDLDAAIAKSQEVLPAGMEISQVSNQPQVVRGSINTFVTALGEAVAIVLFISFLTLGARTGMVVAICIPLVLCGVFTTMYFMNISLQQVSLGALIIALGLLVDDEIIAVEMMSVKLESGLDHLNAAKAAFLSTSRPLLTGTLVTIAGFIPVGFSKGQAAEFVHSLFPVIAAALLISWLISLTVAPFLGVRLIKVKNAGSEKDIYKGKFYDKFRLLLDVCLTHRKTVLISTVICFALSIAALGLIKQEFFPPSSRPEIIVDMYLPNGYSMESSATEAARFSKILDEMPEGKLANYSYYLGGGAPRFVLTVNPGTPQSNFTRFIIVANHADDRSELQAELTKVLNDNFPSVQYNMQVIETGPPADYPIMIRVSGSSIPKVRKIANEVAEIIAQDPTNTDINFNWNEMTKAVKVKLDQDRMRALGVDSYDLAIMLQTEISGVTAAEFYQGNQTIDIVLRLAKDDRDNLSRLKNLPIRVASGGTVPLEQVAEIYFEGEEAAIWRRNLQPTITVQANILSGTANDATQKIYEKTEGIRNNLPYGYTIEAGGALESSNTAMADILAPVPIMLVIICTILMLDLQSIKLMTVVVLTAPLGFIGISFGMLLFNQPMGFVAQLGILALSGMIIRNSVILIDQINQHMASGEDPWHSVIDAVVVRFRPIMLTAAAAIMGMIPLMRDEFWSPMATAIAGGLLVATVLTLLVLPTLYVTWFKVKRTPDTPNY